MTKIKKKRLLLALQIAAVWLLIFSFTFGVVYAWFFKDSPFDIEINPSDFGVEITYDIIGDPKIRYTTRATTVFTYPDDPDPDPLKKDRHFNNCVSVAEITVKNIGAVEIGAEVQVNVKDSSTKDSAGAPVARIGTEFAVQYAIINKSKAEVAPVLDTYGYTDYRRLILEQIAALRVNTIKEMNRDVLDEVTLGNEQSITFLLAFWIDHFALLEEYPYPPKNGPEMQTTYEMTVKVRAKQSENM